MSWRSIRSDTHRIERLTVQLQEAKDLLGRDTAAHARLAFILLDNAAEVMMLRNIEGLLFCNPMYEQLMKQWKEILEYADDARAKAHHDQVKALVVTKTKRARLERSFDAKVDYLIENGRLEAIVGRILKKLHRYRNELYHRDRIRAVTIHTASVLYFELACSLFERGDGYPIGDPLGQKVPRALEVYSDPEDNGRMPTESEIVDHLRQGIRLDAVSLKATLLTHLTSRLDDMDANIAWAGEMLSGFWPDAVVRLAQVHEEGFPDSLHRLLGRKLRFSDADLDRWRQSVEAMRALDDQLELFSAFADIEDEFEPLEVRIDDLVERIEHDIDMEADIRRGK